MLNIETARPWLPWERPLVSASLGSRREWLSFSKLTTLLHTLRAPTVGCPASTANMSRPARKRRCAVRSSKDILETPSSGPHEAQTRHASSALATKGCPRHLRHDRYDATDASGKGRIWLKNILVPKAERSTLTPGTAYAQHEEQSTSVIWHDLTITVLRISLLATVESPNENWTISILVDVHSFTETDSDSARSCE